MKPIKKQTEAAKSGFYCHFYDDDEYSTVNEHRTL